MNKETLNRACLEKAIVDHLKSAHEETRDQLREDLDAGDRINSDLGMAYMTSPTAAFKVTDEAAFLAWVEANQPDQIVTTVQVSPAFRTWVLKRGGLPVGDDLEQVDGIDLVRGTSALTVKPSEKAREWAPVLLGGVLEAPSAEGWPIELEDPS